MERSDVAAPGSRLTVVDQQDDGLVGCDPAGQGGGTAITLLRGHGDTVGGLDALVKHGAMRFA